MVLIVPESVAKVQGDLLELDQGGVSLGPKWIVPGAAGVAGVLRWLLIHGREGKTPVSPAILQG